MLDTVAWAFPAGSFAGVGKRPAVLWELSAVKQRNTVIQAPLGAMAATVVADRDGSATSRFPAWLRRCQASGLARLEGRASASVSDCT
jgi:hypothetical protein